MAYSNFQHCTEEEYKEIIYSGNAEQNLKLWVNNVEIEDIDEYCEQITINSRVFPNGSETFNINELVSKQVEIIVHDLNPSIFNGEIQFSIGTLVDEENSIYEYVPMGIFNIEDMPTTDNGVTTITLRDNSVKFDIPYNAQPLIEQSGGSATLKQILDDICEKCGVVSKVTTFPNQNKLIGIYDNSINGRIYINYIAGQCGAIPIIDRDGELDFKYTNNLTIHKIPLDVVESYKLGKPYRISKVIYESGIIKYEAGTDDYDTMYIDSSNLYINEQEQINDILTIVNNFKVDSVETGYILGDPTIDSYDLIQVYGYYDENDEFVADENTIVFSTFANNNLIYSGVCTTQYETQISEEKRQTNVSLTTNATFKKNIKTEMDLINGVIRLINEEYLDFVKNASGTGYVEINNVSANGILKLEIMGELSDNFPSNNTYPSNNLYPLTSRLVVEDSQGNKQYHNTNINYLSSGDKYVYTYEYDEEKNSYVPNAKIIRNNQSVEYSVVAPLFDFPDGNYKIYLEHFTNAQYQIEYIVQNDLTSVLTPTTQFATTITETRNAIDLQASQKVNKDDIIADLNVAIRDGKGVISLTGNQVVIDSENFKVNGDGTVIASSATLENATIRNSVGQDTASIIIDSGEAYESKIETCIYSGVIELNNNTDDYGAIIEPAIRLNWSATNDYTTLGAAGCYSPTFTPTSREEKKKNFEKFEKGLEILKEVDIYKYNLKSQIDGSKKHIGFVIGDNFKYSKELTDEKELGANLYSFVSVCCQAIKEQQEMIENLQKEVEKLKEER